MGITQRTRRLSCPVCPANASQQWKVRRDRPTIESAEDLFHHSAGRHLQGLSECDSGSLPSAVPQMPAVSTGVSTFESPCPLPGLSGQRPLRVRSFQTSQVSDVWRLSECLGRGQRELERRPDQAQGRVCHGPRAWPSSCHEWQLCLRAHSRGGATSWQTFARW